MNPTKNSFISKQGVSKKGTLIALAASAILLGSFGASEYMARKSSSAKNLNLGASTCFARVSQTFTALMIGDLASPYLSKDFTGMTGECFGQLNRSFDSAFGESFVAAKRPLNKLTSDLFWFHEKSLKVAEMAKGSDMEVGSNSTLAGRFSTLEALNMDFQEKLDERAAGLQTWRDSLIGLAIFGALALTILAMVSGGRRKEEGELSFSDFEELDAEAKKLLESPADLDKLVLKAGRLMGNVFAKIQAPYCEQLYTRAITDLLEKNAGSGFGMSYDEDASAGAGRVVGAASANAAVETPVEEIEETAEETVEFGELARTLMDRMGEKIFTRGVLLEQSLDDDFTINGNGESAQQLLFNLLSFATENAAADPNAESDETPGKIIARSKALGGVAYFKVKVGGYLLKPDEMELFNGGKASENVDINLALIKEIAQEMGVSLTAKNILRGGNNFTGCEIEALFQRSKKDMAASASTEKTATVVKGSKRDILRALSPEA